MEFVNSNTMIEPHLNANGYKFLEHSNKKFRQNDFIRLYKDDTILLGYSNMTTREWDGGAYIRCNINQLKEELVCDKKNSASIELLTGATDGVFVGSPNRVLLSEDSGSLSLWNKSEGGEWSSLWSKEFESEVHDGAILAVTCLEATHTYITGSEDATIRLWEVEDLLLKRTIIYKSAINDVSASIDSSDLFVSAAADGAACVWDSRCGTAQALVKKLTAQSEVRCAQFVDEHGVVIGTEGGVLELFDVRNESATVQSTRLPHPLHRLHVQHSTNRVAVCGESNLLSVYSGKDLACLYKQYVSECDSVRSVAWDNKDQDMLHVAARDGTVCSVATKPVVTATA